MSVPERAGRIVNYLWALAAAVVFVLWLQDPGLFARESIAARIESWGSWMFTGFIGISLVRGFLLVPSTPVILTGGVFSQSRCRWCLRSQSWVSSCRLP